VARARTTSSDEQDHVDRFLAELGELPSIDLEVEGIVDRIMGLRKRLWRMLDETVSSFGVTPGEWSVLGALRHAGPPYRLSPGQLAVKEELSSGAMTNRLDRLEEARLVRRLPDPDDRRALQIELTAKGRKLWEDAVAAQGAKEALIASALDEREKRELNALLRRLMLAFEKREAGGESLSSGS
jgi:DNA-binding MarR family transcriptional regulator